MSYPQKIDINLHEVDSFQDNQNQKFSHQRSQIITVYLHAITLQTTKPTPCLTYLPGPVHQWPLGIQCYEYNPSVFSVIQPLVRLRILLQRDKAFSLDRQNYGGPG